METSTYVFFRTNLFWNFFINLQVLLKMSSIVDEMFTAQIEKCFCQKLSEKSSDRKVIPTSLSGLHAILSERKQKSVLAHVKNTQCLILGWTRALGRKSHPFFLSLTCTSNSALQVYYIFHSEFGKHILGLCSSANMCFQIRPQEMSEGCFWVRANEDQYAKPELLTRVALTFCTQRTGEPPHIFIYLYFI